MWFFQNIAREMQHLPESDTARRMFHPLEFTKLSIHCHRRNTQPILTLVLQHTWYTATQKSNLIEPDTVSNNILSQIPRLSRILPKCTETFTRATSWSSLSLSLSLSLLISNINRTMQIQMMILQKRAAAPKFCEPRHSKFAQWIAVKITRVDWSYTAILDGMSLIHKITNDIWEEENWKGVIG